MTEEKKIATDVPNRGILNLLGEIYRLSPSGTLISIVLFLVGGAFEFLGLASLVPVAVSLLQGGSVEGVYLFSLLRSVGVPTTGVTLNAFLLVVVGAMVIRGAVLLTAYAVIGRIAARLEQKKSAELLRNLICARWEHIMRVGTGTAVDAVSRQAAETAAAANSLGNLLSNGILAFTLTAVALWISPGTVIVALIVAVPLVFTMRFLNRSIHRAASMVSPLYQERNRRAIEMVQQAKYIKAANVEGPLLADFEGLLGQIRDRSQKLRVLYGLGATAPDTLVAGAICVLIAVVAANASDRSQYVTLALMLLYRGFHYANGFQSVRHMIVQWLPAYSELSAISQHSGDAVELPNKTYDLSFEKQIKFNNVNFAYDSVPVLRNFTLEIPKGTILVLQGASGSGKSTIADLLVGLLTPQSGHIEVDGVRLQPEHLAALRKKIAYIPQEPVVFEGTIRHNLLRDAPTATDSELWDAVKAAKFDEVIQGRPEGLEALVGDRGLKLSGGQRQRLALVRAFLRKAELIILDEATSAVDKEREQEILAYIERLDSRLTFVLITHGDSVAQSARSVFLRLQQNKNNDSSPEQKDNGNERALPRG